MWMFIWVKKWEWMNWVDDAPLHYPKNFMLVIKCSLWNNSYCLVSPSLLLHHGTSETRVEVIVRHDTIKPTIFNMCFPKLRSNRRFRSYSQVGSKLIGSNPYTFYSQPSVYDEFNFYSNGDLSK